MERYRTGRHNARNIYRVESGHEEHAGCAFTEDDGRALVAELNERDTLAVEVRRLRVFSDATDRMARDVLEQNQRLWAMIRRVQELHRRVVDDSWPMPGHCAECYEVNSDGEVDYEPYPCPTVRALEGS